MPVGDSGHFGRGVIGAGSRTQFKSGSRSSGGLDGGREGLLVDVDGAHGAHEAGGQHGAYLEDGALGELERRGVLGRGGRRLAAVGGVDHPLGACGVEVEDSLVGEGFAVERDAVLLGKRNVEIDIV